MKIKLIVLYVFPFLLIGLSTFIPFMFFDICINSLFYYVLLKEYNRVGFLNRLCIIYCLFFSVAIFLINSLDVFFIKEITLLLIILLYVPRRNKVSLLLKRIPINQKLLIYFDHIKINEDVLVFGFELKEKEIMWLSSQIILRGETLKNRELEYINDEYLGRNYFVKIS